jgi:hypothetical protein
MLVLYARVSAIDQTTAHQVTHAKAAGFRIDKVVSDEGVSGIATKLCEREQGRRLFDMLRAGDTLVVRWVDRLGRNYTDVVDPIREFMRRGVIIKTVINSMTFDGSTTDPMQQAVRDLYPESRCLWRTASVILAIASYTGSVGFGTALRRVLLKLHRSLLDSPGLSGGIGFANPC